MDHITPVLIRLHWLLVEYRSQYTLILYVFQALHGLAPVYLTELVKPYVPLRSLRSQSASLLQVPIIITKTYDNSRFDKTASTLWNIPLQLKTVDSLSASDFPFTIYKRSYILVKWSNKPPEISYITSKKQLEIT